jgi:diaminopimelate epimerase
MNVWYMSGAGNDFMVVDAQDREMDFSLLTVELCKLTGADGFMAVDHSDKADFKLHFYNSDGSRGEMCGNGARCICKYAYDHGMAGPEMTVETDAGLVRGWRLGEDLYRVQLNNPGVLDLHRRPDAAYVELGNPGVPHSVTELPGLEWSRQDALREKAKVLRFAPEFPKGVNVNFYTWLDGETVRVLTYERGVEDYTLACGTGCGSIASVLWTRGELPGGRLTAHNQGGTLTVAIDGRDGIVESILLEGPAVLVREYEV